MKYFLLVLGIVASISSYGSEKKAGTGEHKKLINVKVVGKVEVASLDCSVTPENDSDYNLAFINHSPEAESIFKACKVDDLCEVSGKAIQDHKLKQYDLVSVKSVRLIKKSQ